MSISSAIPFGRARWRVATKVPHGASFVRGLSFATRRVLAARPEKPRKVRRDHVARSAFLDDSFMSREMGRL